MSDTSAFFAARSRELRERTTPAVDSPASQAGPADDVIYRRMLSEMLGDPHDLVNSPDLDWQSVWDRGWSLAAEAEDKPVEARTAEHGLPVRTPGARLVPGAADDDEPSGDERPGNGIAHPARDPEAVRASFSSHFGGVRTGRTHARETSNGTDQP